jgi:hypothetical protein
MLISYYNYRLTQNSNLVLDANAAIGIQDFQNIGMEYATLDANECSCQTINLDCNITW